MIKCSCTHYPMHSCTGYFVQCKLLMGILVIGLDFLSLAVLQKFVSPLLPTLLELYVYNWDTNVANFKCFLTLFVSTFYICILFFVTHWLADS